MLERIRTVNEYIWEDAEKFQEEWIQCRRADQERGIREDKKRLAQAIVNEYIKKIIVFPSDKSSGKRRQKIKIYFNLPDEVEIPALEQSVTLKQTYGRRKTA